MSVDDKAKKKLNFLKAIDSCNENATGQIAAALASCCQAGDCITLVGDVGAGKTTFARAFIQALSPVQEEIISPTFTLVQTYPLHTGGILWHFDLYRLKYTQELQEIGLEEALQSGITLIEWPEIAKDSLPDGALEVVINAASQPEMRKLHFNASFPQLWQKRLEHLKDEYNA